MRLSLWAVLSGLWFLAASTPASAKVRYLYGKTDRIEAVITRVSISDELGDADYNFNLRPLAPGEPSVFDGPGARVDTDLIGDTWLLWDHDPSAMNEWRARLASAIIGTRGHFSDQCRQCAGTGATGTACEMGLATTSVRRGRGFAPYSYDVREHPCPKLFQCKECLYDMKRHSGEGFDNMSTNAEVFIQDRSSGSCSWNDLNQRIHGAMRALGVDGPCVELEWDSGQRRWRGAGEGSVCGRHVLISGVRSLDQSHDYRPEIHPVTSMVIAQPGLLNWHPYAAATFIDGSYDSAAGGLGAVGGVVGLGTDDWTAEYYQLFRDGDFSPREDIYMSVLQGARPPAGRTANAIQSWAADCDHREQRRHQSINDVSVTNQTASGSAVGGGRDVPVCPKLTVDMEPHACGAAWTAELGAGWRDARVEMVPTTRLLTPQGIIADAERPPVDAPSRNECYKYGPDRANETLKRWYRWEVQANTTYSNDDRNRVSWLWNRDSNLVRLLPVPPPRPPQGRYTFSTWLPTPREGALEQKYTTTLGSVLMMQQEQSLRKSLTMRAPSPTVQITPGRLRPTVAANRVTYAATITAPPRGLCGESRYYGYSWRTNGEPSGNGAELRLTLAPGERKTVNVVAWDRWAVEGAYDTRVFEAPVLDVELAPRCGGVPSADGAAYLAPGAVAMGRASVCRSATLAASASETAGVGFREREHLGLDVRFAWPAADLKYMAPSTGGQWRAVPRAWYSTTKPKPRSATDPIVEELVINLPNETVDIQATVTVTDRFGRTATANVRWTSETFTTPVAQAHVRGTWDWARRGTPLPSPCGDPRSLSCPADGLARRIAWARSVIGTIDPQDPRGQAMIKRIVSTLREGVFSKVARERGLTYNPTPVADFTTKRPPRISEATLQSDARVDFKRRVSEGAIQGLPNALRPLVAPVPIAPLR